MPRVLIVDDQADMVRSMARLLAGIADVTTAGSGAEAFARIQSGERFDVVVCDVMMPGMTGLDLFDRVRILDEKTSEAFVFATGGVSPEFQGRLKATGRRCLTKPCDPVELRGLLGS
jgi:CheY-like chemotaxis protein